jgi:hypothetical protein
MTFQYAKKAIRRTLIAITLTSIAMVLNACGNPDPPVYNGEGVMHIGAWVSPNSVKDASGNYKYVTLEQYQRIADVGINAIYGLYEHIDPNATLLALDLSEEVGIGYYVRDGRIAGLFQDVLDGSLQPIQDDYEADLALFLEAISDYKDHPAFRGNLVYDEPSAELYPWLGFYHDVYAEHLPNKDFYVNLFPTYAGLAARGDRDYEDYVAEYIEIVEPDFVSYDHYPFMLFYEESVMTDDYLLNMEIIANQAKDAGLPFWLFLQSLGYTNVSGTQRRNVTEADLRFQIGVSMAYGTRGIQHFTYWTPEDGSIESFSDAFITRDGEKTPTYDAGKKVNHEVLAFDHVYLDFIWEDVMTYSTTPSFPNVNFRMINSLSSHDRIKSYSGSEDLLIGTFTGKDGEDGFMVVNYTDPAFELVNDVKIDFNDASHVLAYIDGEERIIELKRGKLELTLDSGSYAFMIPYK